MYMHFHLSMQTFFTTSHVTNCDMPFCLCPLQTSQAAQDHSQIDHHNPPHQNLDWILHYCEGVGTLLSSIIPDCKEVTKEDEIGRNQDDETISRMS
jgi:hypothetical protein